MNANLLHPTLQKAQVETAFDDRRPADTVRDTFGAAERQDRAPARRCGLLAGRVDARGVCARDRTVERSCGRRGRATRHQPMFVVPPVKYRTAAEHAAAPEDQLETVEGVLLADLLARKPAGVAQRLGSTPPDVP